MQRNGVKSTLIEKSQSKFDTYLQRVPAFTPHLHARSSHLCFHKSLPQFKHGVKSREPHLTKLWGLSADVTLITQQPKALGEYIYGMVNAESHMAYLVVRIFFEIVLVMGAAHLMHKALIQLAEQGEKALKDTSNPRAPRNDTWTMAEVTLSRPAAHYLMLCSGVYAAHKTVSIVAKGLHIYNEHLPAFADTTLQCLCGILRVLEDMLSPVLIGGLLVFACGAFLRWKDVIVKDLQASRASTLPDSFEVERMIGPLSSAASWIAIATTACAIAHIAGFDMRPVMAWGGISGVVVGLAAQQLLANTLAGITLFFTRPFVHGEQVTLSISSLSVSGTVAQVEPVRTTIVSEDGSVVAIPNKVVVDAVITNRSRTICSPLPSILASPHQLRFKVCLPAQALSSIPALKRAITEVLRLRLKLHPTGVTTEVPRMMSSGADVVFKANLAASYTQDDARGLADAVERIVEVVHENKGTVTW